MSKFKTLASAGAGVVLGYFFDPDMGRTRRARISDQAKAKVRDQIRSLRSSVAYQKGVARGAVYRLTKPLRRGAVDDETLADRIRSQAIGRWRRDATDPGDVEVEVSEGKTFIKGTVSRKGDRKRLLELVEAVDGVDAVEDQLSLG